MAKWYEKMLSPATFVGAVIIGVLVNYLTKFLPEKSKEEVPPGKKDTIAVTSHPPPKDHSKTVSLPVIPKAPVVKEGIVVVGKRNNRFDGALSAGALEWLKEVAGALPVRSMVIDQRIYDDILSGDYISANGIPARYLCLVQASVDYSNSSFSDDLIKAACTYEVSLIDLVKGTLVNHFKHRESPSRLSKLEAVELADSLWKQSLYAEQISLSK